LTSVPSPSAKLAAGARITIDVAGQTLRLPVELRPDLALGVVGLPVGLAGVPPVAAGAIATLAREP
jgi:NADH-quinone oxidoreductase subunit G